MNAVEPLEIPTEDFNTSDADIDLDLSPSDFFGISRELEQHHAIFYQLWELGKPVFTNRLPTAAVAFNKEGECVNFVFNPKFYKSLTPVRRNFIISHECLHVILRHGVRSKDCENREGANVAMDVVINEMLCDQFGYDRDEIDPPTIDPKHPEKGPQRKLCWFDNIFKDRPDVERGQSFEYYYTRLPDGYKLPDGMMLVDIHDFFDGDGEDGVLRRIGGALTDEDKKKIRDILRKQNQDKEKGGMMAGTEALGDWLSVGTGPVKPKQKWETVIKRWMRKFLPNDFDTYEHWARVNRRLVMIPDDAMLPTEMELQDKEDEGKIDVDFYLDTSGSCVHLAARFFKAAKTLPKRRFNVRLFCFDTQVYDVTPEMEKKGKVRGGGGTSFRIIEENIQKRTKKEAALKGKAVKYPEAVFVISDGYGDAYKAQKPERWHWFLTENASMDCIPKASKKHRLKDYE